MNVKIGYQRLICNMWYDIFQVAAAAGIPEELVSKAKQSRSEKKARKAMSKLGKASLYTRLTKACLSLVRHHLYTRLTKACLLNKKRYVKDLLNIACQGIFKLGKNNELLKIYKDLICQ